jgi:hypothetical protein
MCISLHLCMRNGPIIWWGLHVHMYSLCLSRCFSAHYDAVITVLIMKLLFSRKHCWNPWLLVGTKWNIVHQQLYWMLAFQYLFCDNIFNGCLMTWHNFCFVMCVTNVNPNIFVIPSSSECYLKATVSKNMPEKIIFIVTEWLPLWLNCHHNSCRHEGVAWHFILKARHLEMCSMLVQ